MIAIRGAITIEENTEEEIKINTIQMVKTMLEKNNLNKENIISMIFSCTNDITKNYPGKFARESLSLNNIAIMHFNEMEVESENYLPLCIRVTIFYNEKIQDVNHVYLKKARTLRPDLCYND